MSEVVVSLLCSTGKCNVVGATDSSYLEDGRDMAVWHPPDVHTQSIFNLWVKVRPKQARIAVDI